MFVCNHSSEKSFLLYNKYVWGFLKISKDFLEEKDEIIVII